jgi:D-aminopeptidase
MHAKPRGGGFSPHTVGAGLSPYINGKTLTETELIGYSVGTVGLPVILVSGDAHLQRQLMQAMPWVQYAVVKHWISADSVQALPDGEVRSELRERTLDALRQLGRMRPMTLDRPIRAGLLATFPHELPPGLKGGHLPGIHASGDTVWFEAADYRAAWLGIRVLMTIAQGRNAQRSLAFLQQRPDAQAALRALRDSTDAEWLRVEARAAAAR